MIVQQGGRFGGWSLYVHEGRLRYAYNYLGLKTFTASADSVLPDGQVTVAMDFAYDGGKPGAGGKATLLVNGKPVGAARIEKTEANVFSADETANVGKDSETPVTEDYTRKSSVFSGSIEKVTIQLK